MASIPKLVILLLCTCLHTLVAHEGYDLRTYKVLHAGSLKSAAVNCSQPKVTPSSGGVTVPLHHRHGPCSPSPVPSTKAPTLEEMLRRDQLRAAYIRRNQSESGSLLEDQTDGLMGLGGGAQSLATQTAGTFGKAFSYCLPPTPDSSGFLTLGAATSGFSKTQMLRSSQVPSYYGVLLEAIRVGGRQLNIPASVFSGRSIMDSGTIITRLPATAYSALSSAFKAGMKQYPPAQPMGIFDTCFDFSGQSTINIPSVALVFSGEVVVDLATDGIILDSCLAFAANSDDSSLGIIGNVQQRTIEVLYDVGGGAVGFKAGAC
ncbi:Aspartic proteinase nepenthesin-2 [Triticum urartu]|uniref:Aspartic proteinase nepenthesin-2 n=1 Tax=Triticum urartu TaxID=4572 RepID=M8AQF1_TRIUA|nr:Aspartic proteinase nepenthesin-2 [Triticum urartu]